MPDSGAAELRAIAKYLRGGDSRMAREVKKTVTKAAQNIKTAARANLRGQMHTRLLGRLPGAISYDLGTAGVSGYSAEIGPDQSISGLGVGVEFGSRNHAPMPFLFPAADAEEPRFHEAASNAAGDAWEHLP